TAKSRSSWSCRARYTLPMPPRPSNSAILCPGNCASAPARDGPELIRTVLPESLPSNMQRGHRPPKNSASYNAAQVGQVDVEGEAMSGTGEIEFQHLRVKVTAIQRTSNAQRPTS